MKKFFRLFLKAVVLAFKIMVVLLKIMAVLALVPVIVIGFLSQNPKKR